MMIKFWRFDKEGVGLRVGAVKGCGINQDKFKNLSFDSILVYALKHSSKKQKNKIHISNCQTALEKQVIWNGNAGDLFVAGSDKNNIK